MSRRNSSAAVWLLSVIVLLISLAACTPEYAHRQGATLARHAHLLDSIDIERQNQRLLSHQAQVCLVSADGGSEAGAQLLRSMQAGFSGYFVAVSVAGESFDYLRALSSSPCPGASYSFYVQPALSAACDGKQACEGPARYTITVISPGDQSLVDRIQFSIKRSFLPNGADEHERRQQAFEQLAMVLTGGR